MLSLLFREVAGRGESLFIGDRAAVIDAMRLVLRLVDRVCLAAHVEKFHGWTPGFVKLLQPPRQSRGSSSVLVVKI